MKTITCIVCSKDFGIPYTGSNTNSGICPTCQQDINISDAKKQLAVLQSQKDTIFSGLKNLKRQALELELAYTKARDKYESRVNLFERLDREQAEIMLELKLLKEPTKLVTNKPRKPSKQSQSAAKAKALSALNNLDPVTRAIVLAQLNKENESL